MGNTVNAIVSPIHSVALPCLTCCAANYSDGWCARHEASPPSPRAMVPGVFLSCASVQMAEFRSPSPSGAQSRWCRHGGSAATPQMATKQEQFGFECRLPFVRTVAPSPPPPGAAEILKALKAPKKLLIGRGPRRKLAQPFKGGGGGCPPPPPHTPVVPSCKEEPWLLGCRSVGLEEPWPNQEDA